MHILTFAKKKQTVSSSSSLYYSFNCQLRIEKEKEKKNNVNEYCTVTSTRNRLNAPAPWLDKRELYAFYTTLFTFYAILSFHIRMCGALIVDMC